MVGNKADETWVSIPEDEQTAAGLNFGDKTIRRGFIRKVYSILSVQLVVTMAIIGIFRIDSVVQFSSERNEK